MKLPFMMRPRLLVAKRQAIQEVLYPKFEYELKPILNPFMLNDVRYEIKTHDAASFDYFEMDSFDKFIEQIPFAPYTARQTTPTMEFKDIRVNLRQSIRDALKEKIPIQNIVEIFNAENISLILD